MHKDRIEVLSNYSVNKEKRYVLYWMQEAQRIEFNQALFVAMHTANKHDLPLVILFVIKKDFKDAFRRHYVFMLEGILSLKKAFEKLNISFIIEIGDFLDTLTNYIKDAACLIMDKSYLTHLVQVKSQVANAALAQKCLSIMVETEVIVPVRKASTKLEYSARTLRPKLLKQVDFYLEDFTLPKLKESIDLKNPYKDYTLEDFLREINPSKAIKETPYFKGGYDEASKRLKNFIDQNLKDYGNNDPSLGHISTLSPYLHFGQISPNEIYQTIEAYKDTYPNAVENYLEQLLVRRELAFNFVSYQKGYDDFDHMTDSWAYETMKIHLGDKREYIYTIDELKAAKTHDPYFNAAMNEMVKTGFMHNYMRMYWGKKIIEWSPSYKLAYETIKTLNDSYFYDGRDPNSYASIAWLFGKHDRAWTEREIFGKLRYMNANGLKRKFNIEAYVEKIKQLK